MDELVNSICPLNLQFNQHSKNHHGNIMILHKKTVTLRTAGSCYLTEQHSDPQNNKFDKP